MKGLKKVLLLQRHSTLQVVVNVGRSALEYYIGTVLLNNRRREQKRLTRHLCSAR